MADPNGGPGLDGTNDSPLQDQIHNRLEYYFNSLSLPWRAPLRFPMHVGLLCAQDMETKDIDICSFVSGDLPEYSFSPFAYFDRSKFPYVDQPKISPELHKQLVVAATRAGFQLTSNGRSYKQSALSERKRFPLHSTPPIGSVTYVCSRYDTHRKSKIITENNDHQRIQHRGVSLHNNARGNSRGLDGKKGPRKSNSTKAAMSQDTCGFRLNIFWDANGYYIQKGSGFTMHCKHMRRHPKDIPTSIRQYSAKLKETLGELSNGRLTAASGRNYLHSVHGITASLSQVRYAFKVFDADNERFYFGEQAGPTGLLGWLEENKRDISNCVWQAHPQESDLPAIERNANLIFNEETVDGTTTVTDLTEMCREVIHEYQREVKNLQLRQDQNLFIACGWMTKKERRLFRLFPDVLKVDVVKGTNQEDRPLLTVSVRTSQGKYIVVCRMLLSHERKISFRWVFHHALPTLAGRQYMTRVKAIMTDGDSHEMEELDLAIDQYMPQCRRIRCGWHIVFKGFRRRVALENMINKRYKKRYQRFTRAVRNWCYTFMRPGYCETQYELTVSKCILLSYLHSKHVRIFLDGQKRLMVQEYLTSGVFPHDKYFCHVHRRNLRCYEECTNSSHEGTNNGLKQHSCPAARNGTIATTAMNLKLQSDIAIDHEFRKLNTQLEGRPVWNETNAGDESALVELTTFAQDLVADQWQQGRSYNIRRSQSQDHKWYVRYKDTEGEKSVNVLHPVWRRTWEVTMDTSSKRLLCSCGHFERRGLPCRHQAAVFRYEDPVSTGFSFRDCSVVWWKRYMFFSHNSQGPVNDCLQYLYVHDIVGPAMPLRYFDNRLTNPVSCPDFPTGAGSSICINYPSDAIEKALSNFSSILVASGETQLEIRHHDVGLSQESYDAPEYDIDDEIEGIYDFSRRNPPPDDQGIPPEDDPESDNDNESVVESDENDYIVSSDVEQAADYVMYKDDDEVEDILERDEVVNFPGFISLVKEKVREQLDLLEQYSRSGNCNVSRYDLKQVCNECVEPLLQFRLKVAKDIAEHTGQNGGQRYVSSNCVNPSKRRRVRGAQWGLTRFAQADIDS